MTVKMKRRCEACRLNMKGYTIQEIADRLDCTVDEVNELLASRDR